MYTGLNPLLQFCMRPEWFFSDDECMYLGSLDAPDQIAAGGMYWFTAKQDHLSWAAPIVALRDGYWW